MQKHLITWSLAALVFATLSASLAAHGGCFRCSVGQPTAPPGTCPGGSPTGPSSGRPSGPTSPAGVTPSPSPGSGPASPGGKGTPGRGPGSGGLPIGEDLTAWRYWWEFNRDSFINLREAVHHAGETTVSDSWRFFHGAGQTRTARDTLAPSREQVHAIVLPALVRALREASGNRDITTACLVALAKIGEDHAEFALLEQLERHLTSGNQEIQETAALAMGISGMPAAATTLHELALDTPAGRRLAGDRGRVNHRTRSFAIYAMPLLATASPGAELSTGFLNDLSAILADDDISDRNVRVAAINAIGLLRSQSGPLVGEPLRNALTTLDTYLANSDGAGEGLIRAHVPIAIARLLSGADDRELVDTRLRGYAEFLDERPGNELEQSLVLALGALAAPVDSTGTRVTTPSTRAFVALTHYWRQGHDQQARLFSLVAMGRVGGAEPRRFLSNVLRTGSKSIERPWAALGLGVLEFRARRNGGERSPEIAEQLLTQLDGIKDPLARSAICISLGLAGHRAAADRLRAMLAEDWDLAPVGGYLCIGLALLDDLESVPAIQNAITKAVRRPELLRQAATALGRLGDKTVSRQLLGLLAEADTNLAKMSAVASALGLIGDRSTIRPLVDLLQDESLTPLSRAFAAAALGDVVDTRLMPWNSTIAAGTNYRASVETLTNQYDGILDIL